VEYSIALEVQRVGSNSEANDDGNDMYALVNDETTNLEALTALPVRCAAAL
jgi:hypothetical protein